MIKSGTQERHTLSHEEIRAINAVYSPHFSLSYVASKLPSLGPLSRCQLLVLQHDEEHSDDPS